MTDVRSELLRSRHYWLTRVHVPAALLHPSSSPLLRSPSRNGFCALDVEIQDGYIIQLVPTEEGLADSSLSLDCRLGILFPCFVDMHTHLDKGHIWERSPNLSATFDEALRQVYADGEKFWDAEDVYRRMEFGLRCSYAHGTQAIRTHLDSAGEQAAISFEVFSALQQEWRDRLTLQAVSLVSVDYFHTPEGEKLADRVATTEGGVLGGLVLMDKDIDRHLDRVFALARERHLALDFHVDESGDPSDIALRHVANATLRHQFAGQVVCGHCCSLSVQSPDEVIKTLDQVKAAGIGVVSLPMCNLFLQDRNQSSALNPDLSALIQSTTTPRWRGVTLLHELKHWGVPTAVASDNCRDPFYGFGDHDGLEVLTQSTRIAHLDAPYGDWCRTVTATPANLMGLPSVGRIGVGLPADLILFRARYFSELFSRPQGDRLVLRRGIPIDTTLPDYAELDDLLVRSPTQALVKNFSTQLGAETNRSRE